LIVIFSPDGSCFGRQQRKKKPKPLAERKNGNAEAGSH